LKNDRAIGLVPTTYIGPYDDILKVNEEKIVKVLGLI